MPTGRPRKEAELQKCPPMAVLLPSLLKKWLVSSVETYPFLWMRGRTLPRVGAVFRLQSLILSSSFLSLLPPGFCSGCEQPTYTLPGTTCCPGVHPGRMQKVTLTLELSPYRRNGHL